MTENVTLDPFVYIENTENKANPRAGIELNDGDVASIEQIMASIAERRDSSALGGSEELFAGITPDQVGNNTLLVVDAMSTADGIGYVVRTHAIGASGVSTPTKEEFARPAISSRGPLQRIQTSLGTLEVGQSIPDPRFEPREGGSELAPYAAFVDSEGKRRRVVSVADALRPPTQAEIVASAEDALDIDRHAGRYPEINNGSIQTRGRWHSSGRRGAVEAALYDIKEAVGKPGLGPKDRERLVNLGHEIMRIADAFPENTGSGAVLDPHMALEMAHAEATHRNRQIKGFLSRKSRQEANLRDAERAAYHASDAYTQSLREPQ